MLDFNIGDFFIEFKEINGLYRVFVSSKDGTKKLPILVEEKIIPTAKTVMLRLDNLKTAPLDFFCQNLTGCFSILMKRY